MQKPLLSLILAAVVLVVLLPLSSARADITADGFWVYIDVDVSFNSFTCSKAPAQDLANRLVAYYLAWEPTAGDSCSEPTTIYNDPEFGDKTYCHLMILSPDSNCVYFNTRFELKQSDTTLGMKDLIVRIPVDEEINSSSVYFSNASDYDSIATGYFGSSFTLQRGEAYVIRLSEQVRGCDNENYEHVLFLQPVYIPCCGVFTGGIKGNTNCDGAGIIDSLDVDRLIDRVYLSHTPLCCEANGDVDSDDDMDLSDITILISYINQGTPEPDSCQY